MQKLKTETVLKQAEMNADEFPICDIVNDSFLGLGYCLTVEIRFSGEGVLFSPA